jgi:hypothetical protein
MAMVTSVPDQVFVAPDDSVGTVLRPDSVRKVDP